MTTLEHEGYEAAFESTSPGPKMTGFVTNTVARIEFTGNSFDELQAAFPTAIAAYRAWCESHGYVPEAPGSKVGVTRSAAELQDITASLELGTDKNSQLKPIIEALRATYYPLPVELQLLLAEMLDGSAKSNFKFVLTRGKRGNPGGLKYKMKHGLKWARVMVLEKQGWPKDAAKQKVAEEYGVDRSTVYEASKPGRR